MDDHALLAILALILNALLAGPRHWYVALGTLALFSQPARALRTLERKLNREHRSIAERQARGTLLLTLVVLAGGIGGWLLSAALTQNLRFVELLIVAAFLPVRPAWDIAAQIRRKLLEDQLIAAKSVFEGTAWRHHALLDAHGLCRASIELLAVTFAEKIVAPVFWYVLLGLPGLLISRFTYLLHETLAQPLPSQEGFARPAQLFHYTAHYLPARIAAALWLAASIFIPASGMQAARYIAAHFQTKPERLGVGAAAYVLRLSLGGPGSLYTDSTWVGSGTLKAAPGDIKRTQLFYALLHLLLLIMLWAFS